MTGWIQGGRDVILVECYVSVEEAADVHAAAERASVACADLTASGRPVHYLGALLVAADEAAFHLFAAPDVATAMEASRRAQLRLERIVQAVAVPPSAAALSVGGEVEGAIGHPSRQLGP